MKNNSFGNSSAALILGEILINDKKNRAKVSMMLSSFSRTLHELNKIDSRIALGIAKNTLGMYNERCEDFPNEIKTFLRNVISARYKKWFMDLNGSKTYNNRGRK